MRKHFESGLAFMIVAVLSAAAGLLMIVSENRSGLVFLLAGGMWVIVAIGVRNKSRASRKDD